MDPQDSWLQSVYQAHNYRNACLFVNVLVPVFLSPEICILPAIGVTASDSAMIFIILTPAGPYFRIPTALSLLAIGDSVRSWPGGTGGHKLGANYASGFLPQQIAAKQGYQQCLWLLGEQVTEAGAMNFFIVLKRDDGGEL
jgi:branched-chain amino acid aminotransferase